MLGEREERGGKEREEREGEGEKRGRRGEEMTTEFERNFALLVHIHNTIYRDAFVGFIVKRVIQYQHRILQFFPGTFFC